MLKSTFVVSLHNQGLNACYNSSCQKNHTFRSFEYSSFFTPFKKNYEKTQLSNLLPLSAISFISSSPSVFLYDWSGGYLQKDTSKWFRFLCCSWYLFEDHPFKFTFFSKRWWESLVFWIIQRVHDALHPTFLIPSLSGSVFREKESIFGIFIGKTFFNPLRQSTWNR